MYGVSDKKYKIKYKVTNHLSTRTTAYYGPMTDIQMLKTYAPSSEFFSELKCEKCLGEKFEIGHKDYAVCGYSIGEVMLMPFSDLGKWVKRVKKEHKEAGIDFSISQLEMFSNKACELNLGYLFINRNIPSLSGGELQRLRLIQIFSSQLSDLLIVLDEPLAGLSANEKKIVYDNIITLSQKHTLLIVDHHELFIDVAEQIYALGPNGGKRGGELIDSSNYITSQRISYEYSPLPISAEYEIKLDSKVYNYEGVMISFAKNCLNVISGSSGVGKSTLLREYLPQFFDNYLYINQKPMGGNVRSTVATDLDISSRIIQMFSKEFKQDKSFFSNIASGDGACKTCSGTGQIIYGSQSQTQLVLTCKDCQGTGFDKKLGKYKIAGKSIQDVWHMTIDEAIIFFEDLDRKVTEKLMYANKLLLGHLELGEKTSELSGGENIRMKLIKAIASDNKVIGIDEPFKGLNQDEIYTVVQSLDKLVSQEKTIIVVDHEESSYRYFSRHIELVCQNGVLCEKS